MKVFACLLSLVLLSAVPLFAQARPYHKHKHLRFICFAQNEEGKLFRALGVRAHSTQTRAMNNCYGESDQCAELGCRIRRR